MKGKTEVSRADARGIKAFRDARPRLDIAPCERFERISEQDCALPRDLGGA